MAPWRRFDSSKLLDMMAAPFEPGFASGLGGRFVGGFPWVESAFVTGFEIESRLFPGVKFAGNRTWRRPLREIEVAAGRRASGSRRSDIRLGARIWARFPRI